MLLCHPSAGGSSVSTLMRALEYTDILERSLGRETDSCLTGSSHGVYGRGSRSFTAVTTTGTAIEVSIKPPTSVAKADIKARSSRSKDSAPGKQLSEVSEKGVTLSAEVEVAAEASRRGSAKASIPAKAPVKRRLPESLPASTRTNGIRKPPTTISVGNSRHGR
jgi:hypothetical protein